jgi:uroporphyrin-III C-methyltransferase
MSFAMDPISSPTGDYEQAPPPVGGPPRASPPATPLGKPVSRGIVAIVAIALAGIGGLAWFDARNSGEVLRADLTKRVADQDAALAQAKARDSDQTGEIFESRAKLALLETRMAELQTQQASLEALYRDIAPSRDEILLDEIEQMLLLATQQLSLAANVPAALTALQMADARLAGTNRAQLTPLRRAIAKDMERLKAIPTVDVPGVALKLDRALATIDMLPLAQDERLPEPAPVQVPRDEPAWLAFLRSAWNDMRSLVRIEVSDRPAAPLVSPSQQYFLRENLRLRLLSARVALLSRDEASFKDDIVAANAWVKKYFDMRAKPVQALTATLAQLVTTVIPADLPDVNDSILALRAVKAGREHRAEAGSASAPPTAARKP